MNRPCVYALCESENVAETLAVLLEPECEYVPLLAAREPDRRLPRPALVLDARRPRSRDDSRTLEKCWPGVRIARFDLLARLDPAAAREMVARELRVANQGGRVAQAIEMQGSAIAAEIKPRLLATRCLIGMARHSEIWGHAAWQNLLREQLVALSEPLRRSVPLDPS